ncbi:MAG TPA: hypothetical protein VGI55_18260 [Solirubrobacteraceae bacterium]
MATVCGCGGAPATGSAGPSAKLNTSSHPHLPSAIDLRQAWSDLWRFAVCMRSHHVPSWPTPSASPQHPARPVFDLQAAGINPYTNPVSTQLRDCATLTHVSSTLNMLQLH